jgi:hypothetical protein
VQGAGASLGKLRRAARRHGRLADMVVLKGDKEIGDRMNKIISKLAEQRG